MEPPGTGTTAIKQKNTFNIIQKDNVYNFDSSFSYIVTKIFS